MVVATTTAVRYSRVNHLTLLRKSINYFPDAHRRAPDRLEKGGKPTQI